MQGLKVKAHHMGSSCHIVLAGPWIETTPRQCQVCSNNNLTLENGDMRQMAHDEESSLLKAKLEGDKHFYTHAITHRGPKRTECSVQNYTAIKFKAADPC